MSSTTIRECARCNSETAGGRRCKRTSCKWGPKCWAHSRRDLGLTIKKSKIPGAGLGLFALRDFGPNELIGVYNGKLVSNAVANKDDTGYAVQYTDAKQMEGAGTQTGLARYANNCPRAQRLAGRCPGDQNSYYAVDTTAKRVRLRVHKKGGIKKGQEILASYSAEYWKDSRALLSMENKINAMADAKMTDAEEAKVLKKILGKLKEMQTRDPRKPEYTRKIEKWLKDRTPFDVWERKEPVPRPKKKEKPRVEGTRKSKRVQQREGKEEDQEQEEQEEEQEEEQDWDELSGPSLSEGDESEKEEEPLSEKEEEPLSPLSPADDRRLAAVLGSDTEEWGEESDEESDEGTLTSTILGINLDSANLRPADRRVVEMSLDVEKELQRETRDPAFLDNALRALFQMPQSKLGERLIDYISDVMESGDSQRYDDELREDEDPDSQRYDDHGGTDTKSEEYEEVPGNQAQWSPPPPAPGEDSEYEPISMSGDESPKSEQDEVEILKTWKGTGENKRTKLRTKGGMGKVLFFADPLPPKKNGDCGKWHRYKMSPRGKWYYFEHQVGQQCLRHAVNNLLGKCVFSREDTSNILLQKARHEFSDKKEAKAEYNAMGGKAGPWDMYGFYYYLANTMGFNIRVFIAGGASAQEDLREIVDHARTHPKTKLLVLAEPRGGGGELLKHWMAIKDGLLFDSVKYKGRGHGPRPLIEGGKLDSYYSEPTGVVIVDPQDDWLKKQGFPPGNITGFGAMTNESRDENILMPPKTWFDDKLQNPTGKTPQQWLQEYKKANPTKKKWREQQKAKDAKRNKRKKRRRFSTTPAAGDSGEKVEEDQEAKKIDFVGPFLDKKMTPFEKVVHKMRIKAGHISGREPSVKKRRAGVRKRKQARQKNPRAWVDPL